MLLIIGLWGLHESGWPTGKLGKWRAEVVTTLTNRGLNKEAREALTAGYYEGLLNEGSRLSTMNRFVTDDRRPGWEDNSRPESRQTHDFLFYEHVPNKVTPDYEDHRFRYMLHTNSAGLGDREYSLVKPERTRRIALIGDSITRGLGAPPGGNYESMLEDKLNAAHTTDAIATYEVLNFAVSGYHITQQLESAKVKAAPYAPDVYVIALSDLSVYRRWHGHISTLMYSGIDLKYDFLKKMVAEARLTPDDPIGVFDARLARYRLPTMRWVLRELKDFATSHDAEMAVLLVPSIESPQQLKEAFLGVPELIAELGIPAVNLLDTFAKADDIGLFRVSEGDRHPNAIGHKVLFEHLYERLMSNPAAMQALIGAESTTTTRPAATPN